MGDSPVLTCHVTDCVYNEGLECMAERGIAVGDSQHATCDTYEKGQQGAEAGGDIADVSMCNATTCKFNSNQDCHAPGITVDWHQQHADCDTYHPSQGSRMM